MSNVVDLDKLFHRSKTRILELGEVFTPEQFVEDMLDLVSKGKLNFWNNEDLSFFEPSCGHGNIVLAIYRRRLEALFKKAITQGTKGPALWAVANAVDTIWAIDIDAHNIESCRSRMVLLTLEFLKEKTSASSNIGVIQRNQKFFTHFFCALIWQIHENETLSSLSLANRGNFTKTGSKWIAANGHRPLNFELTWTTYYTQCERQNISPLNYVRARKFVEAVISGSIRGYAEFEFAKFVVPASSAIQPAPLKNLSAGV